METAKIIQLDATAELPVSPKRTMRLAPDDDPFEVAATRQEKSKTAKSFASVEEIDRFVSYFLEKGQFRDALYVVLGLNTGLRPADLLEFKWKHLLECSVPLMKVERKTGKTRNVVINEAVREAMELYLESLNGEYDDDDYIFVSHSSRKGYVPVGHRTTGGSGNVYAMTVQPLRERAVGAILRTAARELGLSTQSRRISIYSLRKTALNAPLGWVSGYKPSAELTAIANGLLIAKNMGNHADMGTTASHYVEIQERLVSAAQYEMNLGLGAIRAYKAKNKG